ncbi:MAG TPA: L,D-transpeptidase family protein [Solirubrobacteraceae bacterium]
MRVSFIPAAACTAAICLGLPAVAAADAPAPPPPAAIAPPAPGKIKLTLQKIGGSPRFAAVNHYVVVRGVVIPYVAGQSVRLTLWRNGRKLSEPTVHVLAVGNGAGQFHFSFKSGAAGLVHASAAHDATPQQAAFSGRSENVRFVNENVGPGASGPSVRLLQQELANEHFAVSLSGTFDESTERALVAFRKLNNLSRIGVAGPQVFKRLSAGAASFHVRYRRDGRHVEANLSKQVLAEIDPHGRVRTIYTMSSGKPSTPTVIGRFSVYSKTPGTNEKGMVDSNYFIRGYAIHGYPEVPTYAASHGCLRIPIPDAPSVFAWVQYGMPVDVYNEGGGGSTHARGNAGP